MRKRGSLPEHQMNEIKRDETRTVAHVSLVTAIAVFSVVLVILNLRGGWERWVIPIIIALAVSCLVMHITAMPQSRIRLYAYSIVLIVYLFYYNTNTDILYNGTPVVMLLVIVISMTKEKRLIWACIVTGSLGMVMRISDPSEAGRVIWHVTLIVAEGAIASGMLKSSEKSSEIYRERIAKLELDNKSADDFLANVSHEIRTPINAVIGLTGVCIDKEKDEEIAEDLRSVSEAGRRIAEQISDILDYSETERDSISVIMEDYRLASLMNDLLIELKPYKSPDLELVIDIDPTLPAVLRTDTLKLKRILWHVILNGLKYTKEGGVYVGITSTVQEYGINLCVDVTDTGVGMTPEELERVFERFYQSDSGRTRVSGGLGLGMPIALGFAEALSGFLTVDSKPDAGTTVHICIPQTVVNEEPCMSVRSKDEFNVGAFLRFERYQDPNVREFYDKMIRNIVKGVRMTLRRVDSIENLKVLNGNVELSHLFIGENEYMEDPEYIDSLSDSMKVVIVCEDSFRPMAGSRASLIRKPFYGFPLVSALNDTEVETGHREKMRCEGIRALVVDDEPMNLMVAKSILDSYGMEVTTAGSGREAVELCEKTSFDIVFMDHMMPEMDGVEAARQIKSRLSGRKLLMVALTANAVSSAREMFMTEGFDGFVSKPVDIMELERVLRTILPESMITYGEAKTKKVIVLERQDEKEDDFTLLSRAGIVPGKGLEFCMNDRKLYVSVLAEYANDSETKVRELQKYYDTEDWENFLVRIHSIKSSSRMIGADELAKTARNIEEAAQEMDIVYVKDMFPKFLPEYQKTAEALQRIYDVDAILAAEAT